MVALLTSDKSVLFYYSKQTIFFTFLVPCKKVVMDDVKTGGRDVRKGSHRLKKKFYERKGMLFVIYRLALTL